MGIELYNYASISVEGVSIGEWPLDATISTTKRLRLRKRLAVSEENGI